MQFPQPTLSINSSSIRFPGFVPTEVSYFLQQYIDKRVILRDTYIHKYKAIISIKTYNFLFSVDKLPRIERKLQTFLSDARWKFHNN